jgi:ergothioneine biosynthesis protein EgtB
MPSNPDLAAAARSALPDVLAVSLVDARAQTLKGFDAWAAALPTLAVPQRDELNPPLWELGHIGWFQEWWTTRNPHCTRGPAADPNVVRPASILPGADALYDSSRVAHATRWSLPLPDAAATRAYLAQSLDATLGQLAATQAVGKVDDTSLYFYRLCLFHEDMHNEAARYMGHTLGVRMPGVRPARGCKEGVIALGEVLHRLGWPGAGFAFDNELRGQDVEVPACEIDASPVSNARFAAFVDAGGYANAAYWSEPGRAWLAGTGRTAPRFWRRQGAGWQQQWFGEWVELDGQAPAMHLNCFEAEAWCAWAGRRLPTEAQWEHAALSAPEFLWGDVWEWSADAFRPYPGFTPHPYRDYSAPWFESRRLLKGASIATDARMRHPRYRNFFTPERDDIFAGFRSCSQ